MEEAMALQRTKVTASTTEEFAETLNAILLLGGYLEKESVTFITEGVWEFRVVLPNEVELEAFRRVKKRLVHNRSLQ